MSTEVIELYRRFRQDTGGIVGESAKWALIHAKTVAEFRAMESAGYVRMRAEAEEENYFDVYGREGNEKDQKRLEEILERDGAWYVHSQAFVGGRWVTVDGVGMCAGYSDPTSPFENCYVPEMMRAALEMVPQDGEH